jgi:hypothetical protein
MFIDERPAAGGAPSFIPVTEKPYVNQAYLKGFVSELHLPMPTFHLSAGERQDVTADILSLRLGP